MFKIYRGWAKRLPEATGKNHEELKWANGVRPVRRVKVAA